MQIGFDELRAQLDGAAKSRHRIFRRVSGGASVCHDPQGLSTSIFEMWP